MAPLTLAILSLAYLTPFVDRGWMPHDEGQLGGNAVRVLGGEIPHIHFQDYSGAMTWLYAGLFRLAGVDVIHIRQALLVAAIITVLVWYLIARRVAGPVGAASAAFVALLWSFPNYFAGLPSWWLVMFASCALLFLLRFAENRGFASLLIAGMFCGLSFTFKQTGLYVLAAAAVIVVYIEQADRELQSRAQATHPSAVLRAILAVGASACLVGLLANRITVSSVVLLGAAPFAAAALPFWDERYRRDGLSRVRLRLLAVYLAVLIGGTLLPVGLWLLPYASRGAWQPLIAGTFQFALTFSRVISYETPSVWLGVGLIPILLILWFGARDYSGGSRAVMAWLVPALIALFHGVQVGHLLIWNVFRFGAVVVVLGSLWWALRRQQPSMNRIVVFSLATMTAFMGLNQFPFSAPVYFCYVAPFAVLSTFAWLGVSGEYARAVRTPLLLAAALFSGLSVNRGYLDNMGYEHAVVRFDSHLGLARASLRVSQDDAVTYQRIAALVERYSHDRTIHAFPDCPEVYFLTAKTSPSPASVEVFDRQTTAQVQRLWDERDVRLIVINHRPRFSGLVERELLVAARTTFRHAEPVGLFEVRWRD